MSLLGYGVETNDNLSQYFNSGVVVLNANHAIHILQHLPYYLNEPVLKRDQGYLNVLAYISNWNITDLGFSWNYLGSFMNQFAEEFLEKTNGLVGAPVEANFVHVTTGLMGGVDIRTHVIEEIEKKWE